MSNTELGSSNPREDRQPGHLGNGSILKLIGVVLVSFFIVCFFLTILFSIRENRKELGLIVDNPAPTRVLKEESVIRNFPNTKENIHVFNDQLATWQMTEDQFRFSAMHYAGTQKVFSSDARRLRAHNPNFLVLNYRLGLGLGYQRIKGNCQPDGNWLEVIEGEKWIREYPETPNDEWFYKIAGQRVLFCDWGWYLMDISNPSWKEYWKTEVLRQLQVNTADGLFVDGLFPPNFYGCDRFVPKLPVKDEVFEKDWSQNIEKLIAFGQSADLARYYFIPNVGEWVTGRDSTDYSNADGVMVEGFARWSNGEYFSAADEDWQLQMDRILRLVNLDKVLLLQQYVNETDFNDRLFLLGSYLLVKGEHTFLNLELSSEPEWFPEYEIQIGTYFGGIPDSIGSLWNKEWGLYSRPYSNGLVLVNPTDTEKKIVLPKSYFQAIPYGGGIIPETADTSAWGIDYAQVDNISLKTNQAAILIENIP